MTGEEKIICKHFLDDADKTHSCNEYKLLMQLLEQESKSEEKIEMIIKQESTTKSETLVSLEVYKQVAWERDIAIEQLHELGYEFGQKIEPTTKNDKIDCQHTDCNNCVNHKYCDYEPTTKNDLGVDYISREKAIDAFPDLLPNIGYNKKAITEILQKLPSVTPQEPRKGHWKHGKELCREYQGKILVNITYKDWHCSNCHCVIEQSEKPKWNFCPNCGSDNREVVEE